MTKSEKMIQARLKLKANEYKMLETHGNIMLDSGRTEEAEECVKRQQLVQSDTDWLEELLEEIQA